MSDIVERTEYALNQWREQRSPLGDFENTYAGILITELLAALKSAREALGAKK